MKLCTIFERNRAIHGAVMSISVIDPNDLERVLGVALGSRTLVQACMRSPELAQYSGDLF